MAKRARVLVLLVGVLLVAVWLGACAACDGTPEAADVEGEAFPGAIPREARETLPEGFPLEVPAMDGEVVGVEAEDVELGPWFYLMDSEHDRETVAAWYRQAYVGRSWSVVDEAEGVTETVLVLAKGAGAWSTVRVRETGGGSQIECWTGIGVPMPLEALPPALGSATEA